MLRKGSDTGVFSSQAVAALAPAGSITMVMNASLCAVDAKYIYRTGGYRLGIVSAQCLRYDISGDQWKEMPNMLQARSSHSSCVLAGYNYVFC